MTRSSEVFSAAWTWRVLVADDQLVVRAGVAALLSQMQGFECAGTVASGPECLAACAAHPPDIVVLDILMPEMDGFAVARALQQRHPAVRVVFLSASTDPALVARAMSCAVLGFVSKDFVLDELAHALHSVAAGRPYVSAQMAMSAARMGSSRAAQVALSPRQRQVLVHIAQGRSNKEIARELGLSVKTVEFHRAEVIQRLDIHEVAGLTRYALENGLTE